MIAVLLSIYNGERYLPALLDSVAAQDRNDWQLYWRDDGSRDASRACLARLPASRGHEIGGQGNANLGYARAFLCLLREADERCEGFAFCDQDDVWLPDKLSRAMTALNAVTPGAPALYCSRQYLTDENLRITGLSPPVRRPTVFANALVQNVATGCTVVLNRAARAVVLACGELPPHIPHDAWCYMAVTGAGGTVHFDPKPSLLYRQHGGNQIGATAALPVRALRALKRGPYDFLDALFVATEALRKGEPIALENRALLTHLVNVRDMPRWEALRAIARLPLFRQTPAETLVLYLWLLIGLVGRTRRLATRDAP